MEEVEKHHMHSEYYSVSQEVAEKIEACKKRGGRVIAPEPPPAEPLESAARESGKIEAKSGWTDIFIYPGFSFKVMDALITNFHLPDVYLLMLVSALSSREKILHAYEEAVKEKSSFLQFWGCHVYSLGIRGKDAYQ